jgi:hypothetical protein
MPKPDRREVVRRFITGEVMKAHPNFDPLVVREVVDKKAAELVAARTPPAR